MTSYICTAFVDPNTAEPGQGGPDPGVQQPAEGQFTLLLPKYLFQGTM